MRPLSIEKGMTLIPSNATADILLSRFCRNMFFLRQDNDRLLQFEKIFDTPSGTSLPPHAVARVSDVRLTK